MTDLRGRMVMPGIVDGHFHGTRVPDCAMGYEGGTIPQILAKLQACLDRPDQAATRGPTSACTRASSLAMRSCRAERQLTRDDLDRLDHDPADPGAQCRRPQVLDEQPCYRKRRHRRDDARPARRPDRP